MTLTQKLCFHVSVLLLLTPDLLNKVSIRTTTVISP